MSGKIVGILQRGSLSPDADRYSTNRILRRPKRCSSKSDKKECDLLLMLRAIIEYDREQHPRTISAINEEDRHVSPFTTFLGCFLDIAAIIIP